MIALRDITSADSITTGRLDASRITAASHEEVRIAQDAYRRCKAMTVTTVGQAMVAWKYAAMAKERCARAGLIEEEIHLCTLLLKYSYQHDRLSQRL